MTLGLKSWGGELGGRRIRPSQLGPADAISSVQEGLEAAVEVQGHRSAEPRLRALWRVPLRPSGVHVGMDVTAGGAKIAVARKVCQRVRVMCEDQRVRQV